MKRKYITVIAVLAVMLLSVSFESGAQEMKAHQKGSATKATYLIVTTHTAEQCLAALDDISAKNPKLLNETLFGCGVGDHRGWTTLQAASETEALQMIPELERKDAKIIKVGHFTVEQIKSYHKKM